MSLSALPFPRYFAYETFLWVHKGLTVLVMFSLWRYDRLDDTAKLVLLISLATYGLISTCRLVRLLYRNYSFGKGWSRCRIYARTSDLSAVELRITPARPLHARCGQYVLVWLPVSLTATFQLHPFSIAWWHSGTGTDGKASELSLLVKPQHGLTARLSMLANSKRELLAAIDGPYGEPIDTTAYGTIMLFASDIGIAGVMAVVKEAMDKRRQWKSNTQRLLLIWQVDNQGSLVRFHCVRVKANEV